MGDVCEYFKSGSFISASKIIRESLYPVFGGNGLRGYTDDFNHEGFYALIGRQGAQCGNITFSTGKAYFTEHAIAVKSFSDKETLFLGYLLLRLKLGRLSDQSAQPGLAVNKLRELTINLPIKSEQESIGLFLERLDDLIAAYERKLTPLKKRKQYFLQAIFSQKLRFKGFTEPWQQRLCKQLLKIRKETWDLDSQPNVDIELENIKSDSGTLTGDTSPRATTRSKFCQDDVLFGRLRPYLHKWWLADTNGVKSGEIWALIAQDISSQFAYVLVQTTKFLEAAELTSGTKMPRAEWQNISELSLSIPTNVKEQEKIGIFFQKSDSLIAAYERKLTLLKQKKQYFLQNLFV